MLSPNESRENSSVLRESKAELNLQDKGKAEQHDLAVDLILLRAEIGPQPPEILPGSIIV